MSRSFMLIRRGLTFEGRTSPPSDPQNGDIYYDITLGSLQKYQNGAWSPFGGAGAVLATVIDDSALVLPTTDPTLIDGHTIVTGDKVLFTTLSSNNNRLYKATVSAGTISWQTLNEFTDGNQNPSKGDMVRVQNGSVNALIEFIYDGSDFVTSGDHSTIGIAEDGLYTDGLFTDFTNKTPIGTPIDRFNSILKALAPPPAPVLSYVSINQSGQSANLSWGSSNPIAGYSNVTAAAGGAALDINGNFPNAGQRKGAFGTSISVKTGTLADNVLAGSGSPTNAYPAKSFGNADQGTLYLEVNGVNIHSVDLTTYGSGSTVNANGSGFSLIAATTVKFPSGDPLTLFKYRTGTWAINLADQVTGHNYVRINHFYNSANHYTNYYEWVNDTNATALTAGSGSLASLSMTGSRYLSGVQYYTGGTALYGAIISNAYRNLYSPSASAISYTSGTGSITAHTIPVMVLESDAITLSNKTFTITTSRLLNEAITVGVNCLHPLKSTLSNAASASIPGILMDSVVTASTATHEGFDSENIRLESVGNTAVNGYDAQADITTGAWDGTQSIANAGPVGYADGLLYYSGGCRYPTQGANSGNFSTITNGPAGNPDYSGNTGVRYMYVRLQNNSGSTRSNFKVNLAGASTTFVAVSSGPSANNVTLEMKFPAGSISTRTGWMDCYNDFATGQWNDGNGARNATAGAGRALATDWGVTIGTKSIAVNEYITIRIAAASTWTGNINDIQLTWL